MPTDGIGAGANGHGPGLRDRDPWGGRRLEVHHVRAQAKLWASHIDPDGPEPRYEEQQQRRAFRLRAARGGGYTLSGFAPETEGALLLSVLDGFTAPGSRRGEAASGGTAGDAACEGKPFGDAPADRSTDQQNFDALHAMVEEHVRSGATAAGTGASTALVVSVTLSALVDYLAAREAGLVEGQGVLPGPPLAHDAFHPPRDGACGTGTGPLGGTAPALDALTRARQARLSRTDEPLPVSALAARLCEDAVRLLITDDAGSPLAYGRSRRLFSPQQRRVLTVRDGGCRAPGCNAPPGWCHAHHVIPWERGGPSDVDNGVLLCSFHHHEVHRGRLVALAASGGDGSPRIVSALTARALEREQGFPSNRAEARPAMGYPPESQARHVNAPPAAAPSGAVPLAASARSASPAAPSARAATPAGRARVAGPAARGLRSGSPVWSAALPDEPLRAWAARYRCHRHVDLATVVPPQASRSLNPLIVNPVGRPLRDAPAHGSGHRAGHPPL